MRQNQKRLLYINTRHTAINYFITELKGIESLSNSEAMSQTVFFSSRKGKYLNKRRWDASKHAFSPAKKGIHRWLRKWLTEMREADNYVIHGKKTSELQIN